MVYGIFVYQDCIFASIVLRLLITQLDLALPILSRSGARGKLCACLADPRCHIYGTTTISYNYAMLYGLSALDTAIYLRLPPPPLCIK